MTGEWWNDGTLRTEVAALHASAAPKKTERPTERAATRAGCTALSETGRCTRDLGHDGRCAYSSSAPRGAEAPIGAPRAADRVVARFGGAETATHAAPRIPLPNYTPEEVFVCFEERAGIIEFDGGEKREDAERMAWESIRLQFGTSMMAQALAFGRAIGHLK